MKVGAALFLAVISMTGIVDAGVILDRSPDAYPNATLNGLDPLSGVYGTLCNGWVGQFCADTVSFTSAQKITGMGIYSWRGVGYQGQLVTVGLWADNGGSPGALLQEFQTTVSDINTDGALTAQAEQINQKYATFPNPINLAANTVYWIGMGAGDINHPDDFKQLGLSSIDDGNMAIFSSGSFQFVAVGLGDTSMRLYGAWDAGSTVTLLGMAFGGLACLRRKG